MFCEREIARKDERRIEMSIAQRSMPFWSQLGARSAADLEGTARDRRSPRHHGWRGREAPNSVTRKSKTEYEEEDLGVVAFVPLIGEQGWAEDGGRSATNHVPGQSRGQALSKNVEDRRFAPRSS